MRTTDVTSSFERIPEALLQMTLILNESDLEQKGTENKFRDPSGPE